MREGVSRLQYDYVPTRVQLLSTCTPRALASEALTSDAESNEEEEDKLLPDDWDEWMHRMIDLITD